MLFDPPVAAEGSLPAPTSSAMASISVVASVAIVVLIGVVAIDDVRIDMIVRRWVIIRRETSLQQLSQRIDLTLQTTYHLLQIGLHLRHHLYRRRD